MKLSELGVAIAVQVIRFIGLPQQTTIESSDGELYYSWKLREPINVRCSTLPEMEPLEVDELFLRESLVQSDKWLKDEKDGSMYIPDYKADFSKGQDIPIYQETTIRAWAKDQRKGDREKGNQGFLAKIEARRGKK